MVIVGDGGVRDGRQIQGVAKNYNNYSVQILDSSGRLHLLHRADGRVRGVR